MIACLGHSVCPVLVSGVTPLIGAGVSISVWEWIWKAGGNKGTPEAAQERGVWLNQNWSKSFLLSYKNISNQEVRNKSGDFLFSRCASGIDLATYAP